MKGLQKRLTNIFRRDMMYIVKDTDSFEESFPVDPYMAQ